MPGMKPVTKHENIPLTSSNTRTLQVPSGGKLHSISLYFKDAAGAAVTEAQIRSELVNVRMTAGGKDLVNASPTLLLDMYEALGSNVHNNTAVAGVLELALGRLVFTDPGMRDVFGLGSQDVSSFQIHVTAGTLSNIASVEVYVEREPINENLGTYCRFLNYQQNFNSASEHSVDTLSRDSSTSYLALLIDDGASGTISQNTIKVGQSLIRENVPLNVNKQFLSNNRMEQPAGYFVVGFTDGTATARLSMEGVKDFSVKTTFSVAPGAGGYNIAALTVENFPSWLK